MSLGIIFYRVTMLPADLSGNPPKVTICYDTARHGYFCKTLCPVSIKEMVGFIKDAYAVQRFFVPDERNGQIDIITQDQLSELRGRCEYVLGKVNEDNFLEIANSTLPDTHLFKEKPAQGDIDWYIEYLKQTIKMLDGFPDLSPNQTFRYSYWY